MKAKNINNFRMEITMKEKKIFLALMETQAYHWAQSRKGFQRLNLSDGQPKILYILKEYEGCVQKELAEMCKIKPSTMTVLLEKMEREGYIVKKQTHISGGKSAKGIYFTEKGKKLANEVDILMENLEMQSFKGFSNEERELLFSMLERVNKNLKQ